MSLPDSIIERATCKIGKLKTGGTGIIVAPNKILTCDHVIENLGESINIIFPFLEKPVEIKVNKKSIRRFSRPIDLALIDFSEFNVENYEIAILEERKVELELAVRAMGFSNRNPEKDYLLGRVEGYAKRDNWDFLKFKNAQVSQGFSGSGLLDTVTNKICGITRISRNPQSDLGGYAIPVETVYKLFPEVAEYQKSDLIENLNWYQYLILKDPITNFHEICKKKIPQQLKKVGQNKYNKNLYIPRASENYINEFINYDKTVTEEILKIVNDLISISGSYKIKVNQQNILKIKESIDSGITVDEINNHIKILKTDFLFDKIDNALEMINGTIAVRNDLYTSDMNDFSSFIIENFNPHSNDHFIIDLLFKAKRYFNTMGRIDTYSDSYKDIIKLLPSIQDSASRYTSNDLINKLNNILFQQASRCMVVTGKAGHGKTNLLCQIVNKVININPVLLFSGQISLGTEYDIEFHVQKIIEENYSVKNTDWIEQLHKSLLQSNDWFFLIIDGINENKNLELLKNSILDFLTKIEGKRIKLIISCRDIFWELFEPKLSDFIFKTPLNLSEYSDLEWLKAQERYFSYYNITGVLSEATKQSLKNPLLLYFFSRTHENSEIGDIKDVRILDLFQLYIEKIKMSHKELTQYIGAYSPIDDFLYTLGKKIIETKDNKVDIELLGINYKETKSSDYMLFMFLKSENIIFEEIEPNNKLSIGFVYDEFLEFIIALTWYRDLNKINLKDSIQSLLGVIVTEVDSFQSTFGALKFLDAILKLEESLINQFLILVKDLYPNWINTRQNLLLNAFDQITYVKANKIIIDFVIEFEAVAASEIKNQLASIILKFYANNTDNRKLFEIIKNVLGVSYTSENNLLDERKRVEQNTDTEGEIKLLPPINFKYGVESKLNAISVLVSHSGLNEISTITQGIYNLGNVDLHSSLEALIAMEKSPDDVIYAIIDKNLREVHPEFKIYSAWLLRDKYGIKPAAYIGELLIDKNTRVHTYVLRLFETRMIEEELIAVILLKLKKVELKNWHIRNYLILLGKNNKMIYKESYYKNQISKIIKTLDIYTYHASNMVRFEAFNAMLNYAKDIPLENHIERMKRDDDVYIKNLVSTHNFT